MESIRTYEEGALVAVEVVDCAPPLFPVVPPNCDCDETEEREVTLRRRSESPEWPDEDARDCWCCWLELPGVAGRLELMNAGEGLGRDPGPLTRIFERTGLS